MASTLLEVGVVGSCVLWTLGPHRDMQEEAAAHSWLSKAISICDFSSPSQKTSHWSYDFSNYPEIHVHSSRAWGSAGSLTPLWSIQIPKSVLSCSPLHPLPLPLFRSPSSLGILYCNSSQSPLPYVSSFPLLQKSYNLERQSLLWFLVVYTMKSKFSRICFCFILTFFIFFLLYLHLIPFYSGKPTSVCCW